MANGQGNCYINKLEKKTMIHEINTLAKALIKNEKKYLTMQDTYRKTIKECKRVLKDKEQDCIKAESDSVSQ